MKNSNSEVEELSNIAWTGLYSDYLRMYEKGLKKEAKVLMKEFIKKLAEINDTDIRYFVDLISKKAFNTRHYSALIPINLYREIFVPVIKGWIKEEPENPIALRWSDELENIKKAVQIDPTDQFALKNIVTG